MRAEPRFFETAPPTVEAWVERLAREPPPVLRSTLAALAALRERPQELDARAVADAVFGDPLMAARVFAELAPRRARSAADIATLERAILMLGLEPFFRAFARLPAVEDRLQTERRALVGLLRVLRRARRAARFACLISTWRNDACAEEIVFAALLHHVGEMLLWIHAPAFALEVRALQAARPGLRSAVAQRAVLGVELGVLQHLIALRWRLPELVAMSAEDVCAGNPQVCSVVLAARFARHSARSLADAALPDDLRELARLLSSTPERVRELLRESSVGRRR